LKLPTHLDYGPLHSDSKHAAFRTASGAIVGALILLIIQQRTNSAVLIVTEFVFDQALEARIALVTIAHKDG
jgi:hypothetical protein